MLIKQVAFDRTINRLFILRRYDVGACRTIVSNYRNDRSKQAAAVHPRLSADEARLLMLPTYGLQLLQGQPKISHLESSIIYAP